MPDEAARSDKLAPTSSGRNAPLATEKDPLKTPAGTGKADNVQKASAEDVSKEEGEQRKVAAEAEEHAAAEAPRKAAFTDSGERDAEQPPENTTGADTPLMSDEQRAARDKRLQMAEDGSRIEQRPLTHPGLKSAQPDHTEYDVERELRDQWPLSYLADATDDGGEGSQNA